MNDKEYTYDIDKYTIGVDENGEDGIGMTVAKIENGGIKFLGNCYGENARCIDLLIKENQELKQKYLNAVADYETTTAEKSELKKHLEVPETCNLKTLEDYKNYYDNTTREQILTDTYIEYCAYVNLAHRYSELNKQVETYEIEGYEQNKELNKMSFDIKKYKTQQKKFIKWLEDMLEDENDIFSVVRVKDVLSKYKEIIGK